MSTRKNDLSTVLCEGWVGKRDLPSKNLRVKLRSTNTVINNVVSQTNPPIKSAIIKPDVNASK